MADRRREVLRSVDIGQGRSAEDIQRDILAAFEEAGVEPGTDYSWYSRFASAGSARQGKHLRLLSESVSGVVAARRWWKANVRNCDDAGPTS